MSGLHLEGTQNIVPILGVLRLAVIRIDRRPSLLSIPFHDVYFIEVERESTRIPEEGNSSDDGIMWMEEVSGGAERVRSMGWECTVLGGW